MDWAVAAALALSLVQDDAEQGYKAYREARYAEAADWFEKALLRQKTPQLWTAFGHASLQAGRWESAVRAYQEAIALKVDSADIYRALAQAYAMGHRLDDAIANFRKAAARDLDGSDSFSIARLRIQQEEWLQAEHELLNYLRAQPASIEGLEALAYVLGRMGRSAEAGGVYRDLERRRPADSKYRISQARLAASQGQFGEALDALETARLLGGLKDEDERLLADLYLQEKMYPEAAACYARRWTLSNPPKAEDGYRMGHAYYESKQFASAEEAFKKVLALDPAHGGSALYLGHLAALKGKADEARRYFAEAMRRMPESPQPSIALGSLEMKAAQWIRAAEAFREALKRGSTESAVAYNLAFCWYQAGRKDEARSALKEALRQSPLDDRLRSLLHEIEG